MYSLIFSPTKGVKQGSQISGLASDCQGISVLPTVGMKMLSQSNYFLVRHSSHDTLLTCPQPALFPSTPKAFKLQSVN